MFRTRSGKVLKRQPSDYQDWHNLDDIATRKQPYSGTWEEMRAHVHSLWPNATYHNSVGSGFWALADDSGTMVAECWPHRKRGSSLWRWRVARPRSGGRLRREFFSPQVKKVVAALDRNPKLRDAILDYYAPEPRAKGKEEPDPTWETPPEMLARAAVLPAQVVLDPKDAEEEGRRIQWCGHHVRSEKRTPPQITQIWQQEGLWVSTDRRLVALAPSHIRGVEPSPRIPDTHCDRAAKFLMGGGTVEVASTPNALVLRRVPTGDILVVPRSNVGPPTLTWDPTAGTPLATFRMPRGALRAALQAVPLTERVAVHVEGETLRILSGGSSVPVAGQMTRIPDSTTILQFRREGIESLMQATVDVVVELWHQGNGQTAHCTLGDRTLILVASKGS